MTLRTGQVLQERYRIDGLLGQGGMGAVYRATDLRFRAAVAIKENLQVTVESQRQFSREASLLYQLRHPNLPRVSDHFTIPNQGQYLVMDYVEGHDLSQILEHQHVIPENQALAWIAGVLDALEYLHSHNVIHRDVKPANIKIRSDATGLTGPARTQAMLVDFGLAKVYDPGMATTVGARGVTPGYAPPEQYGMGRTDARTDLFSVGATLYAMLTGQRPPEALAVVTGTVPLTPPRQLNPQISPNVEAAILRAMAIRPADRFQTASEMRRALLASTAPRSARSAPAMPSAARAAAHADSTRVRPRARPVWVWYAVAGAGALALVLAMVIVVLSGRSGDQKSPPPTTRDTQVAGVTRTATPEPPIVPGTPPATREPAPTNAPTDTPQPLPSPTATAANLPTSTPAGPPAPTEATAPPTVTLIPPSPTPVPPSPTPVLPSPTPVLPTATATAPPPSATPAPPSQPRIAFMSDRSGNDDIWIMNADGSGLTRLTAHGANDYGAAWSPDGRRLAFGSDRDGNWEIYAINAGGGGATRLTNNPAYDHMVTWSANGQRLAFTSDRDGNLDIYTMDADGSGITRLTNDPAVDVMPAWSPAGGRIAFMSGRSGNDEVWVMNTDGSGLVNVSNHPAADRGAGWSPDGTRLAFGSERDGNWEMYVVNADGSGLRRLTNHPAADGGGPWSPDGQRIVFVSDRDGNNEIYVINADGSGLTRLTDYAGRDEAPTWSP